MAVPTLREFVADAIVHAIGLPVRAAGSLDLVVAAAIDGKTSKLTAIVVYTGGLIAMLGCSRPTVCSSRAASGFSAAA
jgi:predicted membrane channel-forming protein YqfA (hemolysin III family)